MEIFQIWKLLHKIIFEYYERKVDKKELADFEVLNGCRRVEDKNYL